MNNLDKTIKKILKNIHYNLGKTLNEQKLIQRASGLSDHELASQRSNGDWDSYYREWFKIKAEKKEGQATINISPTLNRFETIIPGMEFTIPQGGKYSIRPKKWHNRFEQYNKEKAERLFGKWCKGLAGDNLKYGSVSDRNTAEFWWNDETNQQCGVIKDDVWAELYYALGERTGWINGTNYFRQEAYKNMLKAYKDSGAMDDWENTVKNEGNGQTYYSTNGWSQVTLEKGVDYGDGIKIKKDGKYGIYKHKYTRPKGCKPLTVDECLRFSFDSLNQRTKAGMTIFEVIDRSNYDGKNSQTIKTTKWTACLYTQPSSKLDFNNLNSSELKYFYSSTDYPWETNFVGYAKSLEPNSECIDDPHKIIPTDVSFKLPGSEYGSMDYNQKKQLEKETEVKYDYRTEYDFYGNPFKAKLYGKEPTISDEKIKEYKTKKAILSNGGIVAGR